MLYYLHELSASLDLFRSVTLRAAGAMATALLIVIVLGPRFIRYLRSRRIHEDVTKPDSSGLHQLSRGKRGTPTMGGLLILAGLTGSTLLWAMPTNGYVWLTLAVVLALGALGFHDDTVKLTHPESQGLSIRKKLLWQTAIAGAAALALYFGAEPPRFHLDLLWHGRATRARRQPQNAKRPGNCSCPNRCARRAWRAPRVSRRTSRCSCSCELRFELRRGRRLRKEANHLSRAFHSLSQHYRSSVWFGDSPPVLVGLPGLDSGNWRVHDRNWNSPGGR